MKNAIITSLTLLGLAGIGHGASITVGNPSFEEPVLAAGAWSTGAPPSWTAETTGNFVEYIVGFVADGVNHYGMELGQSASQALGVAWQPNTEYQLVIGVGHRNANFSPAGNRSTIALGSTADPGTHLASTFLDASTIPEASFADLTLTYTTGATAPAGDIFIWLGSAADGAGRGHFDNVRLTATPVVPEPSLAALLGLSLAAGARRRRR